MSIEDLEQHGVLLPKEEEGIHSKETTVPELPLMLAFLISVAGCIMTYLGNGNIWSWIGIGSFLISFFLLILICDRAVYRQRRRTLEERRRHRKSEEHGNAG